MSRTTVRLTIMLVVLVLLLALGYTMLHNFTDSLRSVNEQMG